MKTYLALFALASLLTTSVMGQDTNTFENSGVRIFRLETGDFPTITPLCIITADNKKLQIVSARNTNDPLTFKATLNQIKPQWIEAISVLRDQDATDKYGSMGQNGVILIDLKQGILDSMPADLSIRFSEN